MNFSFPFSIIFVQEQGARSNLTDACQLIRFKVSFVPFFVSLIL